MFISFVDKGANQYGLIIEDYKFYINKSDKNGDNMTNEQKNEEPMIPLSAIGKLREIFSINKNDSEKDEKEVDINKGEGASEPAPIADISNRDLLEQLPGAIADSVKGAIGEAVSAIPTDVNIDKSEKNDEEKSDEGSDKTDENSEDKEINKKEEKDDENSEDEKDDDVEINKRQTSMTDVVVDTTSSSDFYKRTGRDHLGRKIRK